jgi:hypothetical protein
VTPASGSLVDTTADIDIGAALSPRGECESDGAVDVGGQRRLFPVLRAVAEAVGRAIALRDDLRDQLAIHVRQPHIPAVE